jgi:tetratricopeptide (TPR) repeat protein
MKIRWLLLIAPLCLASLSGPLRSATGAEALANDRQRIAQALKNKKPQQAARMLEPLLAKFPNDFELANDYALALAQMGELDRARQVLEDALASHPQAGLAFSNLREILNHQAAISYAQAMGKRPPVGQIALKGALEAPEPPVVVAAAPRPDAQIAVPVRPQSPQTQANGAIPSDLTALLSAPPPPELVRKPEAAPALASVSGAQASSALQDDLAAATRRWAQDWSSRNFDAYLSHYSENFKPDRFPSRQAWVENRRPRVARPDPISIEVTDIQAKAIDEASAEVRFRQRYDSRTLKVNSVKRLVWVKEAGVWKIISEDGR